MILPASPTAEKIISAEERIRFIFLYIPNALLFAVILATAEENPVTVSEYIGKNRLYALLK